MYDIKLLKEKKLSEIIEIAETLGIEKVKGLKKQDVIDKILELSKKEKNLQLLKIKFHIGIILPKEILIDLIKIKEPGIKNLILNLKE